MAVAFIMCSIPDAYVIYIYVVKCTSQFVVSMFLKMLRMSTQWFFDIPPVKCFVLQLPGFDIQVRLLNFTRMW